MVSEDRPGVYPTIGGEGQSVVRSEATESDEATRGHHALLETSQQRRLVAGVEIPTLRTLQSGQDISRLRRLSN